MGVETSRHRRQVALGMEWLSSVHPGWERRIDLAKLDMADGCACILGQLADQGDDDNCVSGYDAVCRVASFSVGGDLMQVVAWSGDHGFLAPDRYWIDAIKERFDSGLLSDMEVEG